MGDLKKPDANSLPLVDEAKIEGDMRTEEPLGWDQAPLDIEDPERKRHPRPDGKGGLEAPKR